VTPLPAFRMSPRLPVWAGGGAAAVAAASAAAGGAGGPRPRPPNAGREAPAARAAPPGPAAGAPDGRAGPTATPARAARRRRFPHAQTVRFHLGLLLIYFGDIAQAKRELALARAEGPGTPLGKRAQTLLKAARKP